MTQEIRSIMGATRFDPIETATFFNHFFVIATKALVILCLGFSIAATAEISQNTSLITINRISDGDTIVTSKDLRVRLWGIDAPERDQHYGLEATSALRNLLNRGDLLLETKDVDRYGRIVGIIYTADGTEINLEMVCQGNAWWYERYAKKATGYKSCQRQAQQNKIGLWSVENPISPWDWRRGRKGVERTTGTLSGCGQKKYCKQMRSCEEATFYLNSCGVTSLDGDKDGVPCESLCGN